MKHRDRLLAAFESQRDPIIIGAPQTLLTLNDALTSIRHDSEDVVIEKQEAAKVAVQTDAEPGVSDGPAPEGDIAETDDALVDEAGNPLEDGTTGAPPEAEAGEEGDTSLPPDTDPILTSEDGEPVDDGIEVDETDEEPAPVDEEPADTEEAGEAEESEETEEAGEAEESEEETPDTSDDAEEEEEEVSDEEKEMDEKDKEIDELEEAGKSLESIILAVGGQVRLGGMTPELARSNQLCVNKVLAPIGMAYGKYAVSVESFAKDPISVTLEAERNLKELLLSVIKRIVEAIREGVLTFGKLLGSFSSQTELIRHKMDDCRNALRKLKTTPEIEKKTIDATALYKGLYEGNASKDSIANPEDFIAKALAKVVANGEYMRRYALSCNVVASNAINSFNDEEYKPGDYKASLAQVGFDMFKGSTLPGNVELTADEDTGKPIIAPNTAAGAAADGQECTVMSPSVMLRALNEVGRCVEFMATYIKSLEKSQKDVADLLKVTEQLANKADIDDKKTVDSIRAMSADLPAIVNTMRSGSREYIGYVYTSAARVLTFIGKNVNEYKTA